MVVNNEVWMDSGAMVSMIPEQDIFLGSLDVSGITDNNDGTSKIILNDDFTTAFSLVTNLYRGCQVQFYLVADETFVDETIITANDATSISVPNTLLSAILTDATADDYYGVIKHTGAPVPAPKGSSAGNTVTAQVINVEFKSDTRGDYVNYGIIFGTLPSVGGSEEDVGIFLTTSGSYGNAGSLTGQTEYDIVVTLGSEITTAEEIVDEIVSACNNFASIEFTASRSGANLILTNTHGGVITRVAGTDDGGPDSAIDSLDIADVAEILLTTTTPGRTDTTNNPRLLSDTWIGLTDNIGIPQTAIEMKQIPISSGTRNMAYQFKGAETTSGGTFSLSANNFGWFYYVLGSKTISAANAVAVTLTDIDAQATDAEFYTADNAGGNLAGTNFIFDSDSNQNDRFHRVEGNTICPPWNVITGPANVANVKHLSPTLTNKITYTFSENNSADLPSFALEYTLRKPSLTTVATDVTATNVTGNTSGSASNAVISKNISDKVYTKIYPGCQVESLNLTADAGQEVKMSVNFNSKNTFTAPNNYDTANGTSNLQDWVNFGSPQGGQANIDEGLLRPFFFSDGVIEMFGQEYIRIENMTLDIANSLTPRRFIGRYDKNSQIHIPGARTYSLSFTGLVTDNALFEELRNGSATSLSGTDGHQLKFTFKKDLSATPASDETFTMIFKDYMITVADFPLTNDKGPITVSWTVVPLALHSCTHTTNWVVQG